jgi:hypothetical protein
VEDRLGRIATGMLADLVVLDRDVTRVDPKTLGETRVDMTVVDGRVAFERPAG